MANSESSNQGEEKRKMKNEWRAGCGDDFTVRTKAQIVSGGIWTGVFILLIGVAALLKATVTDLPSWLFSWQTFLIALGFFIGIKHRFQNYTWFILMLVGVAFLLPEIYPDISIRRYIWPSVLILVGAFLILRTRRYSNSQWNMDSKKNQDTVEWEEIKTTGETVSSKEDFVSATSIFGGSKKIIFSKNFKGGDLVSIFGGSEIDLTRADFTGKATIELTNIFGGTKLIIPSSWSVRSDAVVIFGGIEDKRNFTPAAEGEQKILVLKGTVMFGGVDIKSY